MADYSSDKKILGLDQLTGAQVASGDGFVLGDASDSGKAKYVLKTEMVTAIAAEPAKGADDNYVTDAEKVVIGNTSGTNTGDETVTTIKTKLGITTLSGSNTGDQDLTPYFNKSVDDTDDITVGTTNKFATAAEKTKLGFIGVTQNVDLDTIESDTATNNAKVGFTTELAQDAVGAMVNDSLVYDDTANTLGINLNKANVFTADQSVPDDAYDATTWNGNMEVPTKNAIRDKIETMAGGATVQVVAATLGSTQTNYAISGVDTSASVLTILNVTPSTSFKWQSLDTTSWGNGKRVIINNVTEHDSASARCMLFENENGASGTKFLYSYNGTPLIQMPEGVSAWMLLGTKLVLTGATGYGESPSSGWDYFDDMLWTPVSSGSMLPAWKFGAGGTATIAVNSTYTIVTDIRPMGVIGLSTASASAVSSLMLQTANLLEGGRGCASFLTRVGVDTTLSTGSDTWIDYVGFINGDGSAVSNAVGWKYDASVVGNWFTVTANNSVETTTTGQGPTVAVAEMPYLGVFLNGTWGNAEHFFSVDGITWTFCATAHTTNIPTATNRLVSVGANRRRTAGTAARVLAIDMICFNYKSIRTT